MRLTFKVFAGSAGLHPRAQGCMLGYALVLHAFLIIAADGVWAANGSFDINGRMSEIVRAVPRVVGGSGGSVGEEITVSVSLSVSDMNANSLIISS